ncbi:MAG: hypothetical protein ABEN55_16870, partial [Bradymonadaceae bacterium]
MTFDRVIEAVLVGSYPEGPSEIETLEAQGMTDVLCLQTDDDFDWKEIDWGAHRDRYAACGIDVHRVPIRDFDREHLLEQLPEAVDRLAALVEAGGWVYVHCTAGVG